MTLWSPSSLLGHVWIAGECRWLGRDYDSWVKPPFLDHILYPRLKNESAKSPPSKSLAQQRYKNINYRRRLWVIQKIVWGIKIVWRWEGFTSEILWVVLTHKGLCKQGLAGWIDRHHVEGSVSVRGKNMAVWKVWSIWRVFTTPCCDCVQAQNSDQIIKSKF